MNQNIFRKAVEGEFNLNIDIKSRRFDYIVARSCYYYLCRNLLKMSYYEIGKSVGKGHATVIHSLKEFKYILADDKIKSGIYNEKFDRILLFAKNSISQKETNMSIEQLVRSYNHYLILSGKRLKQIEKLKKKIKVKDDDFNSLLNDLLPNTD